MAVCNACCCCSLRIGVIIIILLEVCLGGFGIYGAVGQINTMDEVKEWAETHSDTAEKFGLNADKVTGVLAMNYIAMIIAVASLIAAILMIYPVIPESEAESGKRRVFLLPYVWICASKIVFAVVNVIFTMVTFAHPLMAMIVLVGAAFSIAGSSYFLIMVYSFFQTVRDFNPNDQAGGDPGFKMQPPN